MAVGTRKNIGFMMYPGDEYALHIFYGANELRDRAANMRISLLTLDEHSSHAIPPLDRTGKPYAGIITNDDRNTHLKKLHAAGIPLVNVTMLEPINGIVSVKPDLYATGRMAAEYLLGLHLRHFCIVSFERKQSMLDGFSEKIEEHGGTLHLCSELTEVAERVPRLVKRHKTLGIFCCKDRLAAKFIEEITNSGLRVPHDLAVLGVGNNRMLCAGATGISSIELPLEAIGREAALRIGLMLRGKKAASCTLPPLRVVKRDSTGVFGSPEPLVNRALQYMYDNLHKDIRSAGIARMLGTTERTLERHFEKAIGKTLREELLRLRMERAMELLVDTNRPIKNIALQTGYTRFPSFSRMFTAMTGMSPKKYRNSRFNW